MHISGVQIEGLKRNNIGDVFQAIAVSDHLSSVDIVVDRENYSRYSDKGSVLLIANGWYMHEYRNFPPPDNIKPIYSSVHFSNTEILKSKSNRDHFSKFSPIGARDRKTLWMLRAANIPSYYSGCFTIGIKRRPPLDVAEELLIVDGVDHPLSEKQIQRINSSLRLSGRRVSHDPSNRDLPFEEYRKAAMKHANELLRQYCSAKCVVTTKIHCALPCLAMGVPVILVHPNPEEERLAAVKEFMPIVGMDRIGELSIEMAKRSDSKRIDRKKKFIKEFISDSVRYSGNPAALSPRFRGLRIRSKLETMAAYLALRILYKGGFHRRRLNKVMKHGT